MSSNIPSRKNWYIRDGTVATELQLSSLVDMYIGYMLDRTLMMFEYQNLPDGITPKDMEKFTQLQGQSFFIKHNNRFYILYGSFSNYVTWNCEPKEALLVNPALPDLKTKYVIDEDVIVYPNDAYYMGLFPMLQNNAIQMAQADISLSYAGFNTRLKTMFTADDDNTKDSIDKMLEGIWNGEKIRAILSENLYKKSVEGISYSNGQVNDITSLIELKQYIKANWYMDLGINANYNMKRETLNDGELQANDDVLMPLIDNMLKVRREALDKINQKWGLNITIDFSSSWKKIKKEIENKALLEEAEIEAVQEEPKGDDADGKAD